MVEPIWLRIAAGAGVALGMMKVARGVAAEGERCGLGLVLDVPDATANDIASAVCSAARSQGVPGSLRIGLVQASRLAVTVARVDANGSEQVVRLEARDANDAIQRAPVLVRVWAAAPAAKDEPPDVRSAPVEAETPSPGVALAPTPQETPPAADVAPKPQTKESMSRPRLIPGLILGVHGGISASRIATGVAPGGGMSVGLGDEHVQGLADFTYSQNEEGTPTSFRHFLLTGGARLVIGDAFVRPAVGGGWSISYAEAGRVNRAGHSEGGGLGVYGEAGLFVVPSKGHQIGALARMNIPLYEGEQTTTYPNATYDVPRSELMPVQLTFLLAYVHPFK